MKNVKKIFAGLVAVVMIATSMILAPTTTVAAVKHNRKPIIAVSHYMFTPYFKTEESAEKTLKRLRAIGFEYFDLCSMFMTKNKFFEGTPYDIEYNYDWHKLLSEADMKVSSILDAFESISKDPKKYTDMAKSFNTKNVVAVMASSYDYTSKESVKKYVADLNATGKAFHDAGLVFSFHSHSLELAKMAGTDETALEYILKNVNPDYVKFTYDPVWVQFSGASPMEYLEKAGASTNILHITDCGLDAKNPQITPTNNFERELGYGNMNLKKLLDVSTNRYGTNTVVIEQHSNYINNDPFESAKIGYDFLKKQFGF